MNKTKNNPYDALDHFNATLDNAYFDNSLSKDDIILEMEKYAAAKNREISDLLKKAKLILSGYMADRDDAPEQDYKLLDSIDKLIDSQG